MAYRRSVPRVLVTLAAALAVVAIAPITGAQAAPGTTHCVSQAVPAHSKQVAAPPTCYATFAESIAQATHGAVHLPANATTVTQAQLDAGYRQTGRASVIIGISYWDAGFSGSTTIHEAASNCDTTDWAISYVGNTWNDQISSAKAFSGCTGIYYEHSNYGGVSVNTNWSGGAMNDNTSSIYWV